MLVGAPSSALKKTNQPREKGATSDPTQPNSTQPYSSNRPIQLDDTKKQGLLTRGGGGGGGEGQVRFVGSAPPYLVVQSGDLAVQHRCLLDAGSTAAREPTGEGAREHKTINPAKRDGNIDRVGKHTRNVQLQKSPQKKDNRE